MIIIEKQIFKSVLIWTLAILIYTYLGIILYSKFYVDLIAFSFQIFWIFSIAFPSSIIFATAFTYRGRINSLTEIIVYFKQKIFIFLSLSVILLLFTSYVVPHFNHIIADRLAVASGSSNPNNYKSDREKTISELYIDQANMVISPKVKRQYLYEIYKKIALAFSILSNAFLGLSLAIIFKKKSILNSILLFISCFILYQFFVALFIGLEDLEYFNPFAIMMIPLIVNLFIGLSLVVMDNVFKKIKLKINKEI